MEPADRRDRAIATVLGYFVSDAAAQPLHWNTDMDKLDALVGAKTDSLEFWDPSENPFYSLETGRGTAYADLTLTLLESLVACQGFDPADYTKRLQTTFAAGSEFVKDIDIEGSWRPHQVIKDFMANCAEGGESTGRTEIHDMHAVVAVVPIVALYAGRSDMLEKVEDSIAVLMDVEEAIVVGLAAARILEQFVLNPGIDGDAALEAVMDQLACSSRNNPNHLDRAVISQMRKAAGNKSCEHRATALKHFTVS